MSSVKILRETEDTVTISRADWQRLQEELEDARDRAAVAERRAHERLVGKAVARADYLTASEAMRLLDGESPAKVWRQKRGLSQRALAAEASIAASYLAEIESGRKPGSGDALRKLAAVLRVPSEELDGRRYRTRNPGYGPVVLRLSPVSAGVSPGNRGAWADRQDFLTLQQALDFVCDNWSSLHTRNPRITGGNGEPIYDAQELMREAER